MVFLFMIFACFCVLFILKSFFLRFIFTFIIGGILSVSKFPFIFDSPILILLLICLLFAFNILIFRLLFFIILVYLIFLLLSELPLDL